MSRLCRLYFFGLCAVILMLSVTRNVVAKDLPKGDVKSILEPYFVRACFELEKQVLTGQIDVEDANLPQLRNTIARLLTEDEWKFDQRRLNGFINLRRKATSSLNLEDATLISTYVETDFRQKKGPLFDSSARLARFVEIMEIGYRREWATRDELEEAKEQFQVEKRITARTGKSKPDTQSIYESLRRAVDVLEKKIRLGKISPEDIQDDKLIQAVEKDLMTRNFDVPNGWVQSVIHARKRIELDSGSYVTKELPDLYIRTSFVHRAGGLFSLLRQENQKEAKNETKKYFIDQASARNEATNVESPHLEISKLLVRFSTAFLFYGRARFRKADTSLDIDGHPSQTMNEAKSHLERLLNSRDIHTFLPYSILIGDGIYDPKKNRFRITTESRFAMLIPELTSSGAFSEWYGLIIEPSKDGLEIIYFEQFKQKTVFSNLRVLAQEISRLREIKGESVVPLYTLISNVAYAQTGLMRYTVYSRGGKSIVENLNMVHVMLENELQQLAFEKSLPPSILRRLRNGLAKGAFDPFSQSYGSHLRSAIIQRLGFAQHVFRKHGADNLVSLNSELHSVFVRKAVNPLTAEKVLDQWIQEVICFLNLHGSELEKEESRLLTRFLPDLAELRVMLSYLDGLKVGEESSFYAVLAQAHRLLEKAPEILSVRLQPYTTLTFPAFQKRLMPQFNAQATPFRLIISR